MLCGCGEERSGEQAGAAKEAARSSSGTSRPDSAEKISTKKARQIQDEQERIARAVQTAPAMTRTYKHPLGPFFLYPDGWTLRTSQNGLMLLPPKPLKIAGVRVRSP